MHCHHLYRMRAPTHMRLRSSSNQHRRHRPGVAGTSSLATCPLIPSTTEKPAMARLSAISMGGHWLLLVSLLAAMSGSDRLVSSEPVSVKVFDASTCAGPCPGCTKAAAFIAAGAMQWDHGLKRHRLIRALSRRRRAAGRESRGRRARVLLARVRGGTECEGALPRHERQGTKPAGSPHQRRWLLARVHGQCLRCVQ